MSSRLVLLAFALVFARPTLGLAGTDAPTIERPNAGALCDRLAGDANDTDYEGDGVADDDIDAKTAEAACREAVAEHPGERRYLTELARAVRKGSDGSAALPIYQRAADLGSAHALYGMGSIYESGDGVDQDFAKAADYYRRAMDAGSVAAISSLGYLYDSGELGGNGAAEALKLYEKQIAAGDNYGLVDLGSLYEFGRGTAKDEKKAEEIFRQAIADEDPDISAYGKNALAWMFAVDGRHLQEAEDLATAAVAYDVKDPYYLDTLSLVQHRLGHDREAAADSEKAIAMESEAPGFYLRLGDIRAALGETAAARAAWQKALSLDPPNAYEEPDWNAEAIRKKLDALPP